MLRRAILAVLLSIAPAMGSAACNGQDYLSSLSPTIRAELDAKVATIPFAEGIFWRASRGDTTLHIVGTMHLADPRSAPIFDRVSPHLTEADVLLVEAGPDEQAAMQSAITNDPTFIFIVDGPTLPEQLDADLWDAVRDAVSARGIPSIIAAKMQPWYLALTLSIPPCAMAEIAAGAKGLDFQLIDLATEKQVPVVALEPWDTLFNLMRGDANEDQIEGLILALAAPETQSALFVAMLNAYFAEDVARVWEASRIATKEVPGISPEEAEQIFLETEARVLTARNEAWIPVIEDAARRHDRLFFAAGAAHLPGASGVLALLEANGWRIERLPLAD